MTEYRDQKRNDVADRRRDRRTATSGGGRKTNVDQSALNTRLTRFAAMLVTIEIRVLPTPLSGGNRQTDAVKKLPNMIIRK
ncbi:MAG: hypothetical protein ACLVJ6_13285 [Merdibacter sp.]